DISSAQHLLHHVPRHVVEEESQDSQQKEDRDDLDGEPPVLVTDQVFRCFERDEEPQEGDIWTAGGGGTETERDAHHLLHHVPRHAVEEESQDGQQQEGREQFDGEPPVLVTDQVLRCFERDEEPQEGDIWTAGGGGGTET
ncbi:hypothetical protein F7725_008564, partial [Dissostichus mawsoni]